MKHCLFFAVLSFAAVLLLWLTPRPGLAQSDQPPEIAMVVALQGAGAARHAGLPPRPLALYSPLFAGDVITVAAGGQAVVRFANGQSRALTAVSPASARRLVSPPAAPNTSLVRLARAVFDAQCATYSRASRTAHTTVRGGNDVSPVQALCPRGQTRRAGLTFRWALLTPGPVRISLFDGDGKPLWSRADVAGDHLVYPADAPPLMPDQDYQWLVAAEQGGSSEEALFETVSTAMEQTTAADLEALSRLPFASAEDRCLARASLLAQNQLYAEEVAALQALPAARQSPLTHAVLLAAWTALGEPGMAAQERQALGEQPPAVCQQWEQP